MMEYEERRKEEHGGKYWQAGGGKRYRMDGRTDGWMGAARGEADGKEGGTLPAGKLM